MANGHAVIPINDAQLEKNRIAEYLENEWIFIPPTIPRGRFPTLTELRHTIQELGYDLEETHDWYVTSEDDFTEIWFRGENKLENNPREFWFLRGSKIVWNLTQALTNTCGSLLVLNHSGSPNILFVPESLFSPESSPAPATDYFQIMIDRLPLMLERLLTAAPEDKLFYLSQIHQAAHSREPIYQAKFFEALRPGVDTFARLLKDADARIRYLAFDLVAIVRERFYDMAAALKSAIQNETNTATKTYMIYRLEPLLIPGWISGEVHQPAKGILNVLAEILNDDKAQPPICLAAAQLLARSQPGLQTPSIREIFIDALIHPGSYDSVKSSGYSINQQILTSIQNMLINHRIDILMTALPKMTIAQHAHEILRALLDQVFFGADHPTQLSSLPDIHLAERPKIDETKFDQNLSRSWLYPLNPTKLTAEELLPLQRSVLEMVNDLDIPWMVHSNLLEKYGLPPTRSLLKTFLANTP